MSSTSILGTASPPWKRALRVGAVYLVVSAVWIYFSDSVVQGLVQDPETMTRVQTWKGWGFVLVSTALIVFLVHLEVSRTRQAGRRFQALVEQSLAGVYLIRGNGFLYVNPTLARVFGYEPREMVESLRVSDVVAEEDRDLVLGNVARREQGTENELHYRFTGVHRDGREIRVEVHGARIDWQGRPAVLGVLIDVDDRERLERQLRQSQKLESLGALTGQVAHDFNNFLTGIIGPLDLCLDHLPLGGEARTEVEEAREAAQRAASLSKKLLTFSRHRPTVPRIVDVNQVVLEATPLLERLVGSTVTLDLQLSPEPLTVRIDPTDLEQVVMNLTLNAAEATGEGGRVTLRSGGGGAAPTGRSPGRDKGGVRSSVWIEVEDDGPGVPGELQADIFDPFFTTKEEGTGLGLSTVFGVVGQAGGEVDLESEPGAGARFRVLLPEIPGAARGPVPTRMAGPRAKPVRSGTILVVEDEEPVLRTVDRALRRAGYSVVTAPDGATALEAAADSRNPPDLLLSDVHLPDASGPEIAGRVRELRPDIGIVYMSGYSSHEVMRQLAAAPHGAIVEKPFSIQTLVDAVERALGADEEGGGRTSGRG